MYRLHHRFLNDFCNIGKTRFRAQSLLFSSRCILLFIYLFVVRFYRTASLRGYPFSNFLSSAQLSGAGYSSCVSFGLCSSLESCKLNRAKRLLQAMLNERIVSLGGTLRLSPLACLTTRKLSVLWLKLRQAYQAGRTTTAPKPANGGPKCAISAARDGATVSVR